MENKTHSKNPHQKEFFNKQAKEWDEITSHDPEKLEFIVKLLSLQQGQTVLDVGTGTGVMIPYLYSYVQRKGKIVAVDYSKKMIEVSKRKYPLQEYPNVKFLTKDIIALSMLHEYDSILCYSCFPHFSDKVETVKHLVKGLKKGGKLMIAHSESRDAINNLHKDTLEVSADFLPTMREIAKMMESSGLKVIVKIDNDEMFIIIAKHQ